MTQVDASHVGVVVEPEVLVDAEIGRSRSAVLNQGMSHPIRDLSARWPSIFSALTISRPSTNTKTYSPRSLNANCMQTDKVR